MDVSIAPTRVDGLASALCGLVCCVSDVHDILCYGPHCLLFCTPSDTHVFAEFHRFCPRQFSASLHGSWSLTILTHSISNSYHKPAWETMSAIKAKILSVWDGAPTPVKLCCIKFVQRVILAQTASNGSEPKVVTVLLAFLGYSLTADGSTLAWTST